LERLLEIIDTWQNADDSCVRCNRSPGLVSVL
jgi:hypothetical protein